MTLRQGLAASDRPRVRREGEGWVVRWTPYYIVQNGNLTTGSFA